MNEFVDPITKKGLKKNASDFLSSIDGETVYPLRDGIYDFVHRSGVYEERVHYDGKYSGEEITGLSMAECVQKWSDPAAPENAILLSALGDLTGKTMLLLGNGVSFKELHFLALGAKVVYTDLSFEAVHHMQARYLASEYAARGLRDMEFYAVDAMHLPFPSEIFDVIYGYAFVHHLDDLDGLFSEIVRCLKPGGVCRFLDDAYSPLWEFLKKGPLAPLRWHAHRTKGISPEDLRASERGGFRQEELEEIQRQFGFRSILVKRTSFFQYMLTRFASKFLKGIEAVKMLIPLSLMLDSVLAEKTSCLRKHTIRLIWGFDK